MKKIVIATSNKGKIKDIDVIFKLFGINDKFEVLGLADFPNVPNDFDVEEPCLTYEGNAIIKALEYAKLVNELVLADDSGLEVDILDGRPGIKSSRYGGYIEWQEKREKLLSEIGEDTPDEKRGARFVCTIALYDPKNLKLRTSRGLVQGIITREIKGDNGFGFDPVFYHERFRKTFAQLSAEEKNSVSHRFKALEQACQILKSEFI